MVYLLILFVFLLLTSILFKKDLYDFFWILLASSFLYLIIHFILPLPEGFNNDQYVYLDLVNEGDTNSFKTFYHNLFKSYFFLQGKVVIEYVQYFLGLSNLYLIFLLFKRGLNNRKMFLFLILCSGYTLHIFTFLREPFLFLLITYYVYLVLKNRFLLSLVLIVLIGLARADALLYALPFLILRLSSGFKHIYKVTLFGYSLLYWLIFMGPLSVYTEPYIRAFLLLSDLESDNSLIHNSLNLITPSLSLPKILFQIQFLGGLYYIFKLKGNMNLYKTSISIFSFTLIILLTISNNYGWLLRITSGMALMFYLIEAHFYESKKQANAS
jgi:hypothetical protein